LYWIVVVARIADRWEAHFLLWLVFQRLQVQFEDRGFAVGSLDTLVEALAALLAQPAARKQFAHNLGDLEGLVLLIVGSVVIHILGDVHERVQAGEIGGTEDS